MPLYFESRPKAQLFEFEVLAAEFDLARERHQFPVVGHQNTKQIRHVLQCDFGAPRILAYQRQYGIQAVEQKMRADARLQCLKSRLRERRRQRSAAQVEIREQRRSDEE